MEKIFEWDGIREDYAHTLLLGNGASIAIDPCFSYESLLASARDRGHINEQIQRIFDYLRTEDFELALKVLWHTYHVNRALGTDDRATRTAYEDVRSALIAVIRETHTDYDTVRPYLERIYQFMCRFEDVVSLNYDVIVYWAMLAGNDELGRWFKDCFVDRFFDKNWERFYDPLDADGTTLVFYPHGNLILATSLFEGELKVRRETELDHLLDTIIEDWGTGEITPIFVSEGDRRQKERAIHRSDYLSTVFNDVLPSLGPSVVIYGLSFHDNDDHILGQLGRGEIDRMAVSVHIGDRDRDEVQENVSRIKRKLRRFCRGALVRFFDAETRGCWIY